MLFPPQCSESSPCCCPTGLLHGAVSDHKGAMNGIETREIETKALCAACIGDDFLRDEIERLGKAQRCSYCGKRRKAYGLGKMADRVEEAFAQHFERTFEYDYDGERKGEPVVDVIMNSADISEEAAQDVQCLLEDRHADWGAAQIGEETEFSAESHYEEKRPNDLPWQERWTGFERSLKTQARFFDRQAVEHLMTIFGGIERIRTWQGRPMVIDAGPGTAVELLYRARVFQSVPQLERALERPDRDLGPPPASAAKAGRMNAHGISVFYGATEPGVALGEVRPPVGSRVAMGSFRILRPLRLLDLTALEEAAALGSVYDPDLAAQHGRARFLRSLGRRMTRPVMPDDEALDYLPTQAIADFLATEATPALDGVLFPSAQAAGEGANVVLFHKAARVEPIALPDGTTFVVNSWQVGDEGGHYDYHVDEEVPLETGRGGPTEPVEDNDWGLESWPPQAAPIEIDSRMPTLGLDLKEITVHHVERVQIHADECRVSRSRRRKDEPLEY